MIFNMIGGGGASLNYEVIGGTSAPSNPSENTIWINTSTTITSHIFSATEPTNPSPGMVWITVGTSSTIAFSATEENPVMIYPLSAKQYVSGAWVDKTAKSYQNGAWVDWIAVLYDNGNELVSWTGAWTKNAGNLYGTGSKTDYKYEYTAEKYNLTNFNKLLVYGDYIRGSSTEYQQLYIGVASAISDNSVTAVAYTACDAGIGQIFSLENLPDGEYYIYLQAPRNLNSDAKAYAYKVWLE